MATFDYPSDVVQHIAYQPTERRVLRSNSRVAASLAEGEKQIELPSNIQGNEAGNIFYFIEPRPRNPWAAIASLIFLFAVVLALIVIPLLHTDPIPKMATLTMLYLQPPAAAPANITSYQAPKLASTYSPVRTNISAPDHEVQEAPPAPVGTVGGVVGGVPGGVVGGFSGGVFSGMVNGAPSIPVLAKAPAESPVKRTRIAARVAEANLIHDVPPQYPAEAGRSRIEGTVVLMAVIDKDGTVRDVRVESGLPILAQAAIDAVKQWRYKPYVIDGQPVEVDSRITINFTLSAS
jgi:protein TonB